MERTPLLPPVVKRDSRVTGAKILCSALAAAIGVVFSFNATAALAASKGKHRHSAPARSAFGASTPSQGAGAENRLRNIMKICRCDEYDHAKGAY